MSKIYEYIIASRNAFSKTFKQFRSESRQAGSDADKLNKKIRGTDSSAKNLGNTLGGMKRLLLGAFAVGTLLAFGNELISTTAKAQGMRNAIIFASGSAEEGNKNLEYLQNTANRLGLSLEASQSGFKTLAASMMGSSIQGQGVRDIFEGVSIGASAMGLSAEQSEGAFLALGQMMGKGKVQAEELRGQLGERIPGAFNIAARAMGVTSAQLNKMMEGGQVIAEDFLPKFAAEMKKTFSPALGDSVNSLQANLNRFNNELYLTKDFLGTGMMPMVTKVMAKLNNGFQFLRNNAAALGRVFSPLKSLFMPVLDVLGKFTSSTGGLENVFNRIGNALAFMQPVLTSVGNLMGTIVDKVIGITTALAGNSAFQRWAKMFVDTIAHVGTVAKDVIGGIGDMFIGLLEGKWSTFKTGAKSLGSGLLGALSTPFQPMKSMLSDMPKEQNFFGKKAEGKTDTGGTATTAAFGMSPTGGSSSTSTSETKKGINSVAGGGGKAININFENVRLAENITINSNVVESMKTVEPTLRDSLGRILNGGIYTATQ